MVFLPWALLHRRGRLGLQQTWQDCEPRDFCVLSPWQTSAPEDGHLPQEPLSE